MTTLHLTNAYHPTSGGIRTFYGALLRAANQHRRRVCLVVPGPSDGVEEVGAFGCIYSIRAGAAPAFDRRYRMIWPTAYLPFGSKAVLRILRREQPALVEVSDKYSLFYLAALLRKGLIPGLSRPTLVGLSSERMDDNLAAFLSRGSMAQLFAHWYLRHVYGPPFDFHIANSEYTADELRRALWDRTPDFVQVCGMGVDAAAFGPQLRDPHLRATLLRRAGGTADSALLLYAGRLSPEKNIRLLLDTMARLSTTSDDERPPTDYRLVVAGDGPLAEAFVREANARVGGRVLWLGTIESRADLARHYASADVFVHPNPCEPFGIGPLEAMASGVPVVLPDAGGVLSYAHRGNAWLSKPDAVAFAEQIRAAWHAPGGSRIATALATADAHAWSHVATRFFALYDNLDTRRRRRAGQRAEPIPETRVTSMERR